MSLLLVSAAGLLLRTIVHLTGIDPGFTPAHVVMLNVRDEAPKPSFGGVDDAARKARRAGRYRVLDERLNTVPGVRSASVSWLGLFGMQDLWEQLIDTEGADDRPLARVDYVSARYFETMGMEILEGRGFRDSDREGMPRVAVINQTLARVRFAGGDPLGRRIALASRGEEDRPFTVVGVVRDSKYNDLRDSRSNPMMWMPITQVPNAISSISLRTVPGAEASVARGAEEVLRATDPDIMVRRTTTLSAEVAGKTSRERLLLGLSSGLAALAILLAAVGLSGTLAYMVSRRTREIGVRLAFGARRDTILRMVVGDALRLAIVALVVGVPPSFAVGYSLRAFLFGRCAHRSRGAGGGLPRDDDRDRAGGVPAGPPRRSGRSDRRAALRVTAAPDCGSRRARARRFHRRSGPRRPLRMIRRRSGLPSRRSTNSCSSRVIGHSLSHARQHHVSRTEPPVMVVSGTTVPNAPQSLQRVGTLKRTGVVGTEAG